MWIVFSLLAALTAAVAITLTKAGLKEMDPNLAFAIQTIFIVTISWSVVLWQKSAPALLQTDRRTWLYLTIAGVATCLSSLFSFRALKLGDAAVVSSLERLSLVLAIIFAAVFLKEQLTWKIIVGAMLMIVGAVLIALSKQTN